MPRFISHEKRGGRHGRIGPEIELMEYDGYNLDLSHSKKG